MKRKVLQEVSKETSKGGLHRTTHTPSGTKIAASDMSKIEHAPVRSIVHGVHGDIRVTTKAKREVALAHTYERHHNG